MTEAQYRGPLTDAQTKALIKHLKTRGELLYADPEKAVFFDTSVFPLIGDFVTGFSRLSIKADGTGTHLRLKEGNPSDVKRKAYTIKIEKKDCASLIYILNRLGLQYGYYRPAFRYDFRVDGVLISIKTQCVMGNHFEFSVPDDFRRHPSLLQLKKKFKLSFWSKRAYRTRITAFMKKFPPVNVFEAKIF